MDACCEISWAGLVTDPRSAVVHGEVVMDPETVGPGRIVLTAHIAPQTVALLVVDVVVRGLVLGYVLDGRPIETEEGGVLGVVVELAVEDAPLGVEDAGGVVAVDDGVLEEEAAVGVPSRNARTRAVLRLPV